MSAGSTSPTGPTPPAAPFHTLTVEAVAELVQADRRTGLSHADAASRLRVHGSNVLVQRGGRTLLDIVIAQFSDFMILVLLAAAIVSAVFGDLKDTVLIAAIVLLNGVVGFTQEYRAERALAALKQLAPARTKVLRDGRQYEIETHLVVPGDVVLLEAGFQVPADLRLTDAHQVTVSEAALTGESVAVDKHAHALQRRDLPLGDRRNMAFKGTTVASGRGVGIAVATGMATELGRIAAMIESAAETATPLQQRLAQLGRVLAIGVVAISAIVFFAGLLRGEPPVLMFLTAVSLAVAAIPEALPATVTIALAFGAGEMAGRNALVRRLSAVETMGSITTICSDKTGTLTRNQMMAATAVTAAGEAPPAGLALAGEPWRSLFLTIALANDAEARDGGFVGEATETALLQAATDAGIDPVTIAGVPRVAELPFDSNRKRMTTIHASGSGWIAYLKGAPEVVIERCLRQRGAAGDSAIDRAAWRERAERLAAAGLRVLACAERSLSALPPPGELAAVEEALTLTGLIGLIDPPRPEAVEAVRACQSAGIRVVMMTGDHPATASAIARHIGIVAGNGGVVTGTALAAMSDAELAAEVLDLRVYARVDPAQKIRVVEALQAHGEFVAMTGDGINDAPALKRADVGVAMGKSGTDVAREVADLILLDDNFATIVAAVRAGRRIYDNLRKVVTYILAGNLAEIATIFLAPFLLMPIPLLPIQILWINLVTDGLPALAMTAEPEEADVMSRPPRPPQESVFAKGAWQRIVVSAAVMTALSLAAQAYGLATASPGWQTLVFTVLAFSQAALAVALRSETSAIVSRGLFTNLPMLGAAGLGATLQLAIIYVPALNAVFSTTPLSAGELAIALGAAALTFASVEAQKALGRRRRRAVA